MIFFDDVDVPIERFVFKLNVNQSYNTMVEQADLEFSLRSFLIKLPVSEPLTKFLPQSKCGFMQLFLDRLLQML